jgi:Ca-activated chloride channel family protein
MGSRGKTVKMGDDLNDDLSEETIRKLTGTWSDFWHRVRQQ